MVSDYCNTKITNINQHLIFSFQSRKNSSLKCPSIRRNLVSEGVLERPSSTEDHSRAVLSTVDSPMKISVFQNGETQLTPKEDEKCFNNLLTDNTEYL